MSPRSNRPATEDSRVRPFYARVLRLRHFQPSGVVCFILFEGSVTAALVLALAEFVSWWGLIVMPVAIALLVKANDMIAGRLARSAHRAEQWERERFQVEAGPAVGRALVPGFGAAAPGYWAAAAPGHGGAVPGTAPGFRAAAPAGRATVPVSLPRYDEHAPGAADRRGTVYASRVRADDQAERGGTDRWGWRGEQPERNGGHPEWAGGRPGWNGEQPERNGGHPEWAGRRLGWAGQQPERTGQQPSGRGPGWNGQPERNGGQSEWPGHQGRWPDVRPGWSSGEHHHG